MIGVQVTKGTNPNEVVLQGNAVGVATTTWYPMVTIPTGCRGELRTLEFSAGQVASGTWTVWLVRLQRGAVTLWQHAKTVTSASNPSLIPDHFDVGVNVQPGDTIDFYVTGTPSFSVTGYCTASLLLPVSATRFVSDESYPICGLLYVDEGRPDICFLAALSNLATFLDHELSVFGGDATRMEAL
jgi:hypothetical protein